MWMFRLYNLWQFAILVLSVKMRTFANGTNRLTLPSIEHAANMAERPNPTSRYRVTNVENTDLKLNLNKLLQFVSWITLSTCARVSKSMHSDK